MKPAILTGDGHLATEDGSTPVTNPCNTGGWAQYGTCEVRIVGDAVVYHFKVHELRHTAASLAIRAGANIKALQNMLGHESAA
jgi:integrase